MRLPDNFVPPPGRRGPNKTVKVTPVANTTLPVSALRTEFGKLLETVMTVPGVLGVVLCDDGGYAIDYVFDERNYSSLDIQLVGAQLGRPLPAVLKTATRHGMPSAVVVVESSTFRLMSAMIADEYVVAAMLARETNLALALRRFEAARTRLITLLVG